MAVKIGEILSAERALANAGDHRESYRWPSKRGTDRLRPAYEPLLSPRFTLDPGTKIFTIGSCFARHIEHYLGGAGFDIPMLSLRVPPEEYYQPASIADKFTPPSALQEIERTLRMMRDPGRMGEIIEEVLFPTTDGRVIDLELREYVPVSRERAHERRRHIFDIFSQAFEADCVVITLGLVECWIDGATNRAIQETPHALALRRIKDRFFLKILDINEVVSCGERLIRCLVENGNPDIKILLTVSPVPLERTFTGLDVVIANAYGKATLRTASQMLYDRFPQVDYFPSYEMVTGSHGAEVWEPDLVHVRGDFVARIVDVLVRNYVRGGQAEGASRTLRPLCTLKPSFLQSGALGWLAMLDDPEIVRQCDTNERPDASPLLLLESGTVLGPPHELHSRILELGGGGYSFWNGTLYFSTSDGSDPNTNGRTYTIAVR